MPTLIRGDRLASSTRAEVLAVFGFRWTVENVERARAWYGACELKLRDLSQAPVENDAEWLRRYAFYVNRDGCLSVRPTRCEPASVAENPACVCCGWMIRAQDSAHQVPGTNTIHCDMCSQGWGACCKKGRVQP